MLDDTKILTDLECFSNVNGAGDVAALAAIYLASRYATNPTLGIKVPAFSFNADTDTIASITGGLLGMLCGTNWIPTEWKIVQDFECLVQMAELLLSDNKKAATKVEIMKAKAQSSDWQNTAIGEMRLIDTKQTPNGKYGFVIIKKWLTLLGQTIYTKEFQPIDNHPSKRTQEDRPMYFDKLPQLVTSENEPQQTTLHQVALTEIIQNPIETKSSERHFLLNASIIKTLLDKQEFRGNVTVGKVFKVIQTFIENDESVTEVAKRFNLDEGMVNLLKMCIK